jgi:hypothetical protein
MSPAKLLKTYPAISAALASVANIAFCHYGLKITGEQLVGDISVVTFILGLVTHSNVTPLAKLAKQVAPSVINTVVSEAGPELAKMEA